MQDSPVALESLTHRRDTIKSRFAEMLPDRPFCCDHFPDMRRRDRDEATQKRHIQPNSDFRWSWMVFDLDHPDSWFEPERRGLPSPNFYAVNRKNGHAHIGYLLTVPVGCSAKSHREPVRLFEDVERGFARRLGADPAYNGLICKNPLHSAWETDWAASGTYDLLRLNDYLDRKDKLKVAAPSSIGRNCAVFDAIRKVGYRQVLKFKKDGRSLNDFATYLSGLAVSVNAEFPFPLWQVELNGIVKSVARWIWDEFTLARFSRIQSKRGKLAWSKTDTLAKSKPWEAEGIGRRAWEIRRKKSIS